MVGSPPVIWSQITPASRILCSSRGELIEVAARELHPIGAAGSQQKILAKKRRSEKIGHPGPSTTKSKSTVCPGSQRMSTKALERKALPPSGWQRPTLPVPCPAPDLPVCRPGYIFLTRGADFPSGGCGGACRPGHPGDEPGRGPGPLSGHGWLGCIGARPQARESLRHGGTPYLPRAELCTFAVLAGGAAWPWWRRPA